MKKITALLLIVILLICMTACRKMQNTDGSDRLSAVEDYVYITQENQSSQQEADKTQSEEVVSDEIQKPWQSTIIAPTTVTFYKNGMQSVSTDKELNHKIAKHIEAWYKGEQYGASCLCYSEESHVTGLKHKEMAIQLEFDDEIKLYGGFIPRTVRTIFIPLTGKDNYVIFARETGPGRWSHFYVDGSGLEQYFEGRQFEPLPEWISTVPVPWKIQLYQKGELLGEYNDIDFTYKVAQHIESWYKYKEGINQTSAGITDETITNIRNKDTYIELFFFSEIKFYDKNMILPETKNLLIPLTGNYAYCIFEAGKDFNYNCFSCCENAKDLEQFFDVLKADNNG